jgi:hypothetical protein
LILFSYPFRHDITLQHYRRLSVTTTVTGQQLRGQFHPASVM